MHPTATQPSPSGTLPHDDLLDDLLLKTSRTFALAIPLLPQPTRREVGIAYLLFRIADTFEDASVLWSRPRQVAALEEFRVLLESPTPQRARELAAAWVEARPSDHAGYLELLGHTPQVLEAFGRLGEAAREVVRQHTLRTALRMAAFVERSDARGILRLGDLADLRAYCYAVAGIVGEACTELFLLGRDHLAPVAAALRERAALFGEGLQLVNILKDSASDAREGRYYLPPEVDRGEVLALARENLRRAAEYVVAVQRAGGPDGIVAFTGLPAALARASLDRLEERGPGAKLTRPEVFRLHNRLQRRIARGEPALEA